MSFLSQCNQKGKTNKQTLDKIIEVGYWKRETSAGPKREDSLILVSSQRRTALEHTSVALPYGRHRFPRLINGIS